MADIEQDDPSAEALVAPAPDQKREKAAAIYTQWRNAHMNELPHAVFAKLEAASEHLISAIVAAL